MTQQSSSSSSSSSTTATRAVIKMIATSHDDSSDSTDSAAATVLRWDEETTTVLRVKEEEVTEVAAGRMTSSSSSSSSSRRKREYHEAVAKQQQQQEEDWESHDEEEATTTTTTMKQPTASFHHIRACSSSSLTRFLRLGLVFVALIVAMAGCGSLTRSSFSSLSVQEGSPPSEDHVSAWFLHSHHHDRLLQSSSSSSTMYNFKNNNNQDQQQQQPQDHFYTNAETADNAEFGSNPHSSHHHSHTVFDSRHVHAPLFPLTASDYWGLGLAVVGLMIAAGGGIGGGGMLVPIYCLVLGFSPKHAIPLSNVTVLGGAVANTVLNSRKRHPADPKRPLIDWDLILVMEPLTIAGALLGAFLNKLLPELLLTVALVVLLAVTAQKSLTKAVRMYKAETKALQQQTGQRPDGTVESELTRLASSTTSQPEEHDEDDEDDDDNNNTADDPAGSQHGDVEQAKSSSAPDAAAASGTTTSTKPPPAAPAAATTTVDRNQSNNNNSAENHDNDDENDETELEEDVWLLQPHVLPLNQQQQDALLQHILQQEQQTFPATNLRILLLLFAVVLSLNLLKGGGAFPSPVGITCGSTAFWWANATILLWIVAVSWHCRNFLLLKYRQKAACGYSYLAGDMVWDERATVVYPAVCCLAGFFAGMFGIGGGIVKGPLMLAMGVHPAVSSASSACMILFTSFTATTSFVVFGLLEQWDYAVTCFTIGVTATAAGQLGLAYLMKRAQRNSYIAFSIGSVVLISAVLMTMQSLLSMAEGEPHNGSSGGGGGICGTDDQYQHHHHHHDEHEQQLRQLLPWQPCGLLP